MTTRMLVVLTLTACGDPAGDSHTTPTGSTTGTGAPTGTAPATEDLAVVFTETPVSDVPEAASWFAWSAPDAAAYRCTLDGAPVGDCDGTSFVVPMTTGAHGFEVVAVGASGASGPPATHDWTITSMFDGPHPELVPTDMMPAPVDDASWRGIFRINCDFAHALYDDPIVFPGVADAAHLHWFYGNLAVDASTTFESLYAIPGSSCQGNTVNGAAYWVPALLAPEYDEITGARLLDANGDPAWEAVPAVVGNDYEAHEVFYYSAGVDDLASVQNLPPGLRMIAGIGSTTPGDPPQDTAIVRWHCQSWDASDGANPMFSATIPECVEPDRLRADLFFPSCWNGVDLDAADHKSHMAYPVNDGGPDGTHCPDTHPIPVLRPSYHYAWPVLPGNSDPATASSRGWRLASDDYEVVPGVAGGLSLHGDWFNGWHPEVLAAALENCVKQGLDCHDGNLANGTRLSGTTPGTQTVPPVVDQGRGHP